MVVDQLALLPRSNDALKLGFKVALRLGIRQFAGERAVKVVDRAEVVAVFARDDCQLVVRMARVWVQFGSKAIVSLCRSPIAFLVLFDQLSFAVAGQVAEVDQRLVA